MYRLNFSETMLVLLWFKTFEARRLVIAIATTEDKSLVLAEPNQ